MRWLVASILALSLTYGSSALAASGDLLKQALDSYNRQDYVQAYRLFSESAGRAPGDGTAWLYAAHCLWRMGNVASASKLYVYVQTNFPKSPNAALAAEMLKRVPPPVLSDAEKVPDVSSAGSVDASSTRTVTSTPKKDAVRETVDAGAGDGSDLLEVVRPLWGHPPVSESTVNAMRRAVKGLSPNVVKTLRSNGARISVTTTLIDKESSLKNREGRGYDGYTYKSCPGMFWNNRIYICERTLDEVDGSVKEPILLASIVGTFYHECGHALDAYSGDLSSSEEFKHLYLLDAGRMDAETKNELSYFLQKSEAGQQECCGELIGVLLGKSDKKAEKMREAFPLTLKWLRSKVNP